ncbi:MAG: hypothetical protein JST22_00640 [Bacteroidetes bacterium]|nr:hypothetical protein [Bacteroidota bacterium]
MLRTPRSHAPTLVVLALLAICCCRSTNAQPAPLLAHFTVVGVTTVASSHDGRYIATAGFESFIRIWNTETGTEIQVIHRPESDIVTVEFMPGDSTLLVVGISDSAFHVID